MKKVFWVTLLLLAVLEKAQSQKVKMRSYFNTFTLNADNGLAQNSVYEVFQDHKGYIWISTADGINRWDGVKTEHFTYIPNDTFSISGTHSFTFFEDSRHRLWIAHNRGLSYFDAMRAKFINFSTNAGQGFIIGENADSLYFGIIDNGIYAINLSSYPFRATLKKKLDRQNISYKSYMPTIKNGDIIITLLSDEPAICYSNLKKREFLLIDSSISRFKPLLPYRQQWLAYKDGSLWLTQQDMASHTAKHLLKLPDSNCNILTAAWRDNKIWLGEEHGYLIIDPEKWQIESLFGNTEDRQNPTDFVYNFYTDRSGNFYICTNTEGVHIISPSRNKFKHLKSPWPENNMVKTIAKTPDGKIITGQYGSHITVYTPDGYVSKIDFNLKYADKAVFGVFNWNDAVVLLVFSNGILWWNHQTQQIVKKWGFDEIGTNQYPHLHFWQGRRCINFNTLRESYIISMSDDMEVQVLQSFTFPLITAWLPINQHMWLLGTLDELITYDIATNKPLLKEPKWVKHITTLKNGQIAVATTTGLIMKDKQGNTVQSININDGLPDGFIYGVLQDAQGRLWLSTNKGLCVLSLETKKIINYTKIDGLQSNEFNTGAYHAAHDGYLYFGGPHGINEINPAQVYTDRVGPNVVINMIWIEDEPWHRLQAAESVQAITLNYDRSTISFDFAALNMSIPERNSYKYKLSGYDNNWIEAGTKHFIRYAKLPPGKYTLQVSASNADGVYGPVRELSIYVKPPFWQTTWFKWIELLLVVLVGFIAFHVVRYAQKLKLEREIAMLRKLENERLRISRDLHDNVGAQLSYLITNLDWLSGHSIHELSESDWQNRLQQLTDAGREAMLTLRETIWAISSTELTFENLADRFKQYALRMKGFAQDMQIEFNERLDINRTLTPATALHLFRIAQEAFHNAVKHSGAQKLNISFTCIPGECSIVFMDNGHGFDLANSHKEGHYGLQNMYTRAKEAQLQLDIESSSAGTRIRIAIPE